MATPPIITLQPGEASFADLCRAWFAPAPVVLSGDYTAAIEASTATVQAIVTRSDPAYGINTGFGLLVKTQILTHELERLQRNLILSHAVGTGKDSSDNVVRLVLLTKAASLARKYSGVYRVVIDTLLALLNASVVPCIPSKGSMGAPGGLVSLAHMTLALLDEGDVRMNDVRTPVRAAQAATGIKPTAPVAKRGLVLVNGTQISTALAFSGLFLVERLPQVATVSGALSVDAAKGSDVPFDPHVHTVCRQAGQIATAIVYCNLLAGSAIRQSYLVDDRRVQSPYNLYCRLQVVGVCFNLTRRAGITLLTEANAVVDNPLIYVDTDEVISGDNSHAEPVAFVADMLVLVIVEIGALSERRITLLTDFMLSGSPPFLVGQPGLNSGFMIVHITAAALASENKTFAHSVSANSLPTSANQEDHVSMATFTGRRLQDMAENTTATIGIEALAATRGVDFHRPLATSDTLQKAHGCVHARVTYYGEDRLFVPDIETVRRLILDGDLGDSRRAHVDKLTLVRPCPPKPNRTSNGAVPVRRKAPRISVGTKRCAVSMYRCR